MTTVSEIYKFIDKIAPFNTAMDFDNVGLLVESSEKEVKNVILSLDITPSTIRQAKDLGSQLIISHHPVIFKPLKRLDHNDIAFLLAKENISAICAHTNLDMAKGGVNDCLAERLELKNIRALDFYNNIPCALIGDLPEILSPFDFANFVKNVLNCNGLRILEGKNPIKNVGICSGAGGASLLSAIKVGADAFLTGEIKHHEILAANQYGISLIEAGHFHTENVVMKPLAKRLRNSFPNVNFYVSEEISDGIRYL